MATVIRDLSQLKGIPELQQEYMTPLLVLLGQMGFVGERVFNLQPSADTAYWEKETFNDKFSLATKIEERGGPQNTDFDVEKQSAEAYDYNLYTAITAKQSRNKNLYSFINLTGLKMNALAERLRMNVERDIVNALLDTTTYTGIKTYSASTAWTSLTTSNPMKDVLLTADKIAAAGYEADTILLGRGDETNLTLSDKLLTATQYTKDYTEDGIERKSLFGYDLFVSNARYKSGASYVRILNKKAILLKKGLSGSLMESQPYLADSDYDKRHKEMILLASRTIVPVVTYEETVGIINNIS